MQNWRKIASEAKDILTVCLAKAIDQALTAENGYDWFQEFASKEVNSPKEHRITRRDQTSTKDMDMQALLKILYFREEEANKVYAYYGIFADRDEAAAQNQKRQLSQLLNRLINDFRNQI